MTVEILRILVAGFIVLMFILGMVYLSRRQLHWTQVAAWGLLALLIPVLGPFLVILMRPGAPRTRAEMMRARSRR